MFFQSAKRPENARRQGRDECRMSTHPTRLGGLSPGTREFVAAAGISALRVSTVKQNGLRGLTPSAMTRYFALQSDITKKH